MTKYHISPKTGRPNVCTAKNACPLGSKEPHFKSKEEARGHVEAEALKEQYSFTTVSKKTSDFALRVYEIEDDGGSWDAENFLRRGLQDDSVEFGETIEAPDYINYTLLHKDDESYIIATTGGEWSSFSVMSADRAVPQTVPQVLTKGEYVDDTGRRGEVNDILHEVSESSEARKLFDSDQAVHISYSSEFTIDREDGSKILGIAVKPPGDRSLTDAPSPVATDIEFGENGERQNAREMDEGFIVYDTRAKTGVLLKHRSGSEGFVESDKFHWDGQKLEPGPPNWAGGVGSIFVLREAGEGEATYYKRS